MDNPHTELRARCPDCAVLVGEAHTDECEVARCLFYGTQRLLCDQLTSYHDHGSDVWTGLWPGAKEAIEHDWYTKYDSDTGEWVETSFDDPDSVPDLQRVSHSLRWSRPHLRYV